MEEAVRERNPFLPVMEFFLVFFLFFASVVAVAFTAGRSGMDALSPEDEDAAFVLVMEQIPETQLSYTRHYDTLSDMLRMETPNLIVRVRFEERGECDVYDPVGGTTQDILWKQAERTAEMIKNHEFYAWDDPLMLAHKAAQSYISTPYTVYVEDVLLGNCVSVGENFCFYANYGFLDTYQRWAIRYEGYPIFSVGQEYILFLYVEDVTKKNGVTERLYSLCSADTALGVSALDDMTFLTYTAYGETLFSAYRHDIRTLAEAITASYTAAPYDLTVTHSQAEEYLAK